MTLTILKASDLKRFCCNQIFFPGELLEESGREREGEKKFLIFFNLLILSVCNT